MSISEENRNELPDDALSAAAGGAKKEPEAYSVGASWVPSCNGQYAEATGVTVKLPPVPCCGRCKHFQCDEEEVMMRSIGVCRREFDFYDLL